MRLHTSSQNPNGQVLALTELGGYATLGAADAHLFHSSDI